MEQLQLSAHYEWWLFNKKPNENPPEAHSSLNEPNVYLTYQDWPPFPSPCTSPADIDKINGLLLRNLKDSSVTSWIQERRDLEYTVKRFWLVELEAQEQHGEEW